MGPSAYPEALPPAHDAPLPPLDEEALIAQEKQLDQWAEELEAQARALAARKQAMLAARAQAEVRRASEEELRCWQEELELQVRRATRQLEVQKRKQVDLCAQFETTIAQNIRKLEQMQVDVRRRASALNLAYETCMHRIRTVCNDAIRERRRALFLPEEQAQRLESATAHSPVALAIDCCSADLDPMDDVFADYDSDGGGCEAQVGPATSSPACPLPASTGVDAPSSFGNFQSPRAWGVSADESTS